jgi:hypothetical protein
MMVFPYEPEQMGRPTLTLGGATERPRPMVPVTVIGPSNAVLRMALLDTGADDSVFPESYATAIGIDLTGAPTERFFSVIRRPVAVRYARVSLRLAAQQEYREWSAWVGFSTTVRRPLLGYAGCLQFFDAHFRGALRQVELTVNDSYPGT